MSRFFGHATLKAAAVLTAVAVSGPVLATDVELLPNGLMTPTTKEQTKANQFKKAPPWRIGVSFGGVGNTWIVQMIQEMKYTASQNKNVGEFIFVEANWQAAKQVADVEDLLTKKVDAIIIGPISAAIGAPLAEKAVKAGIPVVVFGAFGKAMQSSVEIGAGGEVFGQQGGDFLKKEVDNYLHIHKDVAEILENKIKESERERKAMAGVTKLARERAKKANLHNRKLRDCRIHFSDAKNELKEASSIFITEGDSASGSIT